MSKIDPLTKNLLCEDVLVIHAAYEDTPRTVAFVSGEKKLTDTEKLEPAFMKTNTIENAWWSNADVPKMFGGGACRSTSVGDMILIGTTKYKGEPTGWSVV